MPNLRDWIVVVTDGDESKHTTVRAESPSEAFTRAGFDPSEWSDGFVWELVDKNPARSFTAQQRWNWV